MPKKNRETLKKSFGDGEMPSVADFGDLIESMLNINDDGIVINKGEGLRLTQITGNTKVLTFCGDIEQKSAAWSIGVDTHRASLSLGVGVATGERQGERGIDAGDGGGHAVLILLAPGADGLARVGINNSDPRYELDVSGTVSSSGRIGVAGTLVAPADGKWHTISDAYFGCTALEVMAGVGKQNSGKYALMHAFAMKTFGAKGEFTYHQTHHDAKRHRMQLQWIPAANHDKDAYQLQIRVNCAYGDGVRIRYHVTSLWFDPEMHQCELPYSGGMP